MNPSSTNLESRLQAAANAELTAALLASGRHIDAWSRTLALAALITLALLPPKVSATVTAPPSALTHATQFLLALSFVAALAGAYWGWCITLDARLFASWADRWRRPPDAPPSDDLCRFDQALADWRPGNISPASPRTLGERRRGAHRLLKRQVQCLAVQTSTLALALLPLVVRGSS